MPTSSKRRREDEMDDNLKKQKRKRRTWEESFEALQAYKEAHSDCNVPAKFQSDRSLGQWAEKVRRGAIVISQPQRERLTSLGFNWETLEQRIEREWNEKHKRLKAYKMRFGDCRVPTASFRKVEEKIPWAKELGAWVGRQRLLYNRGRLSPERQTKLVAMGFYWIVNSRSTNPDTRKKDLTWFDHYQKLVEFKQKIGHCMVTLSHADTSLFMWVKGQREALARNSMRQDRKKLLDELDFVWKIDDSMPEASHNQRQWGKMFRLLEDYKSKKGHLNVPRSLSPLGSWLDHQKTYWRKGKLCEKRVERLKQVGVKIAGNAPER